MTDYNDLITRLRSMDGKTPMAAADAIAELVDRVAYLESRLEVTPEHDIDGIAARDATIKLQDGRIAELKLRVSQLEAELSAERAAPEPIQCETCQGTGKINETLGGYGFSDPSATCPDCDGSGEIESIHDFRASQWWVKALDEIWGSTSPDVTPDQKRAVAVVHNLLRHVANLGQVTVTTDESGRAVAVTRQDDDHRILSVIWEASPVADPVRLTDAELEADRNTWRGKYIAQAGQLDLLKEAAAFLASERAEREKQEPVAWYIDGEDGREYNGTPKMSGGRIGTPLYAAPPVITQHEPVTTVEDRYNADGKSCHITDDLPAGMKLYAAPPVAAPVRPNDSELEMIARAHGTGGWQTLGDMVTFARAIESAVLRANGFKLEGEQ